MKKQIGYANDPVFQKANKEALLQEYKEELIVPPKQKTIKRFFKRFNKQLAGDIKLIEEISRISDAMRGKVDG